MKTICDRCGNKIRANKDLTKEIKCSFCNKFINPSNSIRNKKNKEDNSLYRKLHKGKIEGLIFGVLIFLVGLFMLYFNILTEDFSSLLIYYALACIIGGCTLFIYFLMNKKNICKTKAYKSLKFFGDPSKIIENINKELLESNSVIKFGRDKSGLSREIMPNICNPQNPGLLSFTKNWIVAEYPFIFTKTEEVIWFFEMKLTQKHELFLKSSNYSIVIRDMWGREINWSGNKKDRESAMELLHTLVPKAIYGFKDELNVKWEADPVACAKELYIHITVKV